MKLPPELLHRLGALLRAETSEFNALVACSGLDPKRSFRGADLRSLDFGAADLRGFDFRGADLRGAKFDAVRYWDPASLVGARLEGATWPAPPYHFDMGEVHRIILEGETPPRGWVPFIREVVLAGHQDFAEPQVLSSLTALQRLYLTDTHVSDVSSLAGLQCLQRLDLGFTQVSDIAPLAELNALQALNLRNTRISNVMPLAGLNALLQLDLSHTQVTNVVPLARLKNLRLLNLSNTRVSDVAPLAGLNALQHLYLSNTQVSDVSALRAIKGLEIIGFAPPGEPRRGLGSTRR